MCTHTSDHIALMQLWYYKILLHAACQSLNGFQFLKMFYMNSVRVQDGDKLQEAGGGGGFMHGFEIVSHGDDTIVPTSHHRGHVRAKTAPGGFGINPGEPRAQAGRPSRKSCACPVSPAPLALWFSNFSSPSSPLSLPLFGSLLRSLWYEHISHSLSFAPSPSLPQDCCFIKQTLPIFHLPLSPTVLPTLRQWIFIYLFILSFTPLLNTHITLALYTSVHCSVVKFSVCIFTIVSIRFF